MSFCLPPNMGWIFNTIVAANITGEATHRRATCGNASNPCTIKAVSVIGVARRIASPEMFPEAEMLPHLICSRPMFIGGAKDEADQHGGA